MSYTIEWTESAETQYLYLIIFLIECWGYKIANRSNIETEKCLLRISATPKLYPIYKSFKNVRKCLVAKKSLLFYTIQGQSIIIIGIYDARVNVDRLQLE